MLSPCEAGWRLLTAASLLSRILKRFRKSFFCARAHQLIIFNTTFVIRHLTLFDEVSSRCSNCILIKLLFKVR